MLSIGCVLAGAIVDRVGAGRFFLVGTVALATVCYAFYTLMFTRPDLLFPLYGLVGLLVGMIGAIPYVMVKSFPAAVRFSGLSFSYNVAYAIFGGLTPMFVSLMMQADKLAPAHYMLAICTLGFATAIYLFRKGV